MRFPRQEYWSGLPCPPPGIFTTQGSNPGLPHHRWILYQRSHQGNPWIPEWVAYPFSRGCSWLRNPNCLAGRFFTNWATRKSESESHSILSDSLLPHGLPGSSVHGILQTRILKRVAIPFIRASSLTRDWNQVSGIASRFFTIWATSEAWATREAPVYFPLSGESKRQWHPTPVLLPGKSHGRRSLVGYRPWGRKESDTTERLHSNISAILIVIFKYKPYSIWNCYDF